MKLVFTLLSFVSLITTACVKEILPESPSCACSEQKEASEAQKWLTATTWQIEEVIDPFSGTRYKRGLISDSKNFGIARYQYHANHTLTGIDWFGAPLEGNCYTLLDRDKKIKLTTPSCSSVGAIINLNAAQFTYKAADGSVITLVPIDSTGSPSKNYSAHL